MLNVKGRIFADLFIYKDNDDRSNETFFVETEGSRILALHNTLKIYQLRRKIEILLLDLEVCYSAEGTENSSVINCYEDPRVPGFGFRCLRTPKISKYNSGRSDIDKENIEYLKIRLQKGIPEGNDLVDQLPLNMNGDLMNAISFTKGNFNFLKK